MPGTGRAWRQGTANDRFKRGEGTWIWIGMVVALAAHAVLFSVVQFDLSELAASEGLREITLLDLNMPPEVHLPPTPVAIPRPPAPRVATVVVLEDTEGPRLDDPRYSPDSPPRERVIPRNRRPMRGPPPIFIPYDTSPVLLNGEEVLEMLQREMSSGLLGSKERRVELWVYVGLEGGVDLAEIKTSSGIDEVDRAGLRVVAQMQFSPARNRGRPVPVWVSQWVTFGTR